jgi:hypothetical protein
MIHSIAQCVSYLTKGIFEFLPSFHILPLKLWVEFWVGMKVGILASHILLSQKPNHKEMQVIHFDREVQVCGIFHIVPISKYFLYSLVSWLSLLDECLLESMSYLYLFSFYFLFFSGGHLSTHCFIHLDTCPFFFSLMPLGTDFLFFFLT